MNVDLYAIDRAFLRLTAIASEEQRGQAQGADRGDQAQRPVAGVVMERSGNSPPASFCSSCR